MVCRSMEKATTAYEKNRLSAAAKTKAAETNHPKYSKVF